MRTLAVFLLITGLAGAAAFNDPQGRYTLDTPAGWKATQLNPDAVQLMNGPAYVTVMVLTGADTGAFLDALAKQTGAQWRAFTEAQRGELKLAGRTGRYITYSGTNPAGTDAFLEMMAISERGSTYLFMISAPKTQFSFYQGAFDQIEKSFTLTSRTLAAPPPAPAPAGAIKTPAAPPAPAPSPAPTVRTAAPAVAPAADAGFYRMKKATVIDEHGFERPLPALSLLIPSDWQFQSSVQYGKGGGCSGNLVKVVFRATSPDGKMALELSLARPGSGPTIPIRCGSCKPAINRWRSTAARDATSCRLWRRAII